MRGVVGMWDVGDVGLRASGASGGCQLNVVCCGWLVLTALHAAVAESGRWMLDGKSLEDEEKIVEVRR